MMLRSGLCLVLAALAAPAMAQGGLREAIPSQLAPADAERLFEAAVSKVCVAAVGQGVRVAQLPLDAREGFTVARDPLTRAEVGAGPEETVWQAVEAGRVVTIREAAGRCTVLTYGPPAALSLSKLAGQLAGETETFERLMTVPGRTGLAQSLFRRTPGRRVQVMLDGSEPGMPGHRSQFSVLSATVFSTPE
jgi:hypothetical protein